MRGILKALLLTYWDSLRSSFWFVPAAMACLAVALAVAAVELDKAVGDDWLERLGWSYSGGAEGASLLLGTVAGSMIAIAGTVFSMTLVAMSLASSQLGPRLLRNFMRDTANQVVLGTFVATFVYCLLVLRTIRRAGQTAIPAHEMKFPAAQRDHTTWRAKAQAHAGAAPPLKQTDAHGGGRGPRAIQP